MPDIIQSLEMLIDDKRRPFESNIIRDAIRQLTPIKPRIMTLEELETLVDGTVVWGEHCYKADGGFTPSTMAPMMRSGRYLVCGGCQLMIEERMFKHPRNWFDDHERFRFWTAKPNEKQREEETWND